VELNDLYNKISIKIQHIDNQMPSQKSAEQYEKMKGFKVMLERTLHFLQVNKSSIQPGFRGKIPIYERQILSFLGASPRVCQILLDKSCDLSTPKIICQVKKQSISKSLTFLTW